MLADRKIQLAPGDSLLMVTDGVVEALGPDRNDFKMDRLAEVFWSAGFRRRPNWWKTSLRKSDGYLPEPARR